MIILVFEVSTMNLSFITGRKVGSDVIYNGDLYTIYIRLKDRFRSAVRSGNVKAKRLCKYHALFTQEKTSVVRVTEYSHPPLTANIQTVMAVSKMKNGSSAKLPAQDVNKDVLVETSGIVQVTLPIYTDLEVQIRRYQVTLPTCTNLEVQIRRYQVTLPTCTDIEVQIRRYQVTLLTCTDLEVQIRRYQVTLPTCTNLEVQIRRYRKKVRNSYDNPPSTALL